MSIAEEACLRLDERTVRALTESMIVLEESAERYQVVSESGRTYAVDGRAETCSCPDFEHRDVECKHLRRVKLATGRVDVATVRESLEDALAERRAERQRLEWALEDLSELISRYEEGLAACSNLDSQRPP